MSDADREWSLLDYNETSVQIWGPTATDPITPNKTMARGFQTLEAGGRISGGSHASGRRLNVCDD
jgi:hypothetical protein